MAGAFFACSGTARPPESGDSLSEKEECVMSKKTKETVIEQMDFCVLLGLFKGRGFPASMRGKGCISGTDTKEDEDYLRNGEKILSILRERAETGARVFKQSEFLDALNMDTYRKKGSRNEKLHYVLQAIARRMLRPAVADAADPDDMDAFCRLIPGFGERMKFLEPDGYAAEIYRYITRKEQPEGLNVHIPWDVCSSEAETGYETVMTVGVTRLGEKNGSIYKRRDAQRYIRYVDTGMFFSALVLTVHLRERVLYLTSGMDNPAEHPAYARVMRYLHDCLEHARDSDGNVYVTRRAYERSFVREFLSGQGIRPENTVMADGAGVEVPESVQAADVSDFASLYLVTRDFHTDELPLAIGNLYSQSGRLCSVLLAGVWINICMDVLDILFQEYGEDKNEWELLSGMRREYARSFETKKNIPERILHAMKNSEYNRFFGYVEYDEEVDLALADKVKEQFFAVAEFIGLKKHPEVSLRFRKLGKHRAKGLYYPFLKCLCVDVRHPDSFAHETFHMIDYENGRLSRNASFQSTLELYRKALTDSVGRMDGKESERLKGRGKYNLNYYLNASEAFARCGEIYLTRMCRVDNSVVNPEKTFAYPDEPELNRSIQAYFDMLLGIDSAGCMKEAV